MSMNEITKLDAQDNFNKTIFKLKAMADLIPHVLEDGDALSLGSENGVAYILEDIAKEMEQFSDEYWALHNDKSNDSQKKLQSLTDDIAVMPKPKTAVAA